MVRDRAVWVLKAKWNISMERLKLIDVKWDCHGHDELVQVIEFAESVNFDVGMDVTLKMRGECLYPMTNEKELTSSPKQWVLIRTGKEGSFLLRVLLSWSISY
jgi:hypothetical protein